MGRKRYEYAVDKVGGSKVIEGSVTVTSLLLYKLYYMVRNVLWRKAYERFRASYQCVE